MRDGDTRDNPSCHGDIRHTRKADCGGAGAPPSQARAPMLLGKPLAWRTGWRAHVLCAGCFTHRHCVCMRLMLTPAPRPTHVSMLRFAKSSREIRSTIHTPNMAKKCCSSRNALFLFGRWFPATGIPFPNRRHLWLALRTQCLLPHVVGRCRTEEDGPRLYTFSSPVGPQACDLCAPGHCRHCAVVVGARHVQESPEGTSAVVQAAAKTRIQIRNRAKTRRADK